MDDNGTKCTNLRRYLYAEVESISINFHKQSINDVIKILLRSTTHFEIIRENHGDVIRINVILLLNSEFILRSPASDSVHVRQRVE